MRSAWSSFLRYDTKDCRWESKSADMVNQTYHGLVVQSSVRLHFSQHVVNDSNHGWGAHGHSKLSRGLQLLVDVEQLQPGLVAV